MGLKDVKNIDYKQKENQTFTNWFWFCVANLWLPITLVGFVLLVLEIVFVRTVAIWVLEAYAEGTGTGLFVTPFLFLPLAMFGVTAYKGCYKHWKYVCGNQKYAE